MGMAVCGVRAWRRVMVGMVQISCGNYGWVGLSPSLHVSVLCWAILARHGGNG